MYEASENWIFVFKIGAILQTNFKCNYLSSYKKYYINIFAER